MAALIVPALSNEPAPFGHASLVHFADFGCLTCLFGLLGHFDLAVLIRSFSFFSFASFIIGKTLFRHISCQLIFRILEKTMRFYGQSTHLQAQIN